jgi:hypothetical protein
MSSFIIGYRQLNQAEIDLINEGKELAEQVGEYVAKVRAAQAKITAEFGTPDGEAQRWISIGATHLQQGFMAVTRGITKPGTF